MLSTGRGRARERQMARKAARKYSRSLGREYVSVTGKTVAPRQLQENPCSGRKCVDKCGMNWTRESRKRVFDGYWAMASSQRQRGFILAHVKKEKKTL